MQWAEVVAPPKEKVLRQFAGLFLIVFLAAAGWRAWQGQADAWAIGMAVTAVAVGVLGLTRPSAVRYIFTGWMIVAFPIGWTISRLALLLMFYLVITPVSLLFRAVGRDELHLRRGATSYWTPKQRPEHVRQYLRQS
jgi:TRAP-type C4-dicarboxylate transport system permease small subunit